MFFVKLPVPASSHSGKPGLRAGGDLGVDLDCFGVFTADLRRVESAIVGPFDQK
jgi:hypothetical protein